MNRAVFLDRDNTLIHADEDVGDPRAVRLIRGAASAVASLRGLGYKIVVVTNQGAVARGIFGEADVAAVNERIAELIVADSGGIIDAFYYCPYHPKGTVEPYNREHVWRKPRPGMLLRAAEDMGLDLSRSWMIGDRMSDAEAGRAAGARTVLLLGERGKAGQAAPADGGPDFTVRNLIEAVRVIGEQPRTERIAESAADPEREVHSTASGAQAAARTSRRGKGRGAAARPSPASGAPPEEHESRRAAARTAAQAVAVPAVDPSGERTVAGNPPSREPIASSVPDRPDEDDTSSAAEPAAPEAADTPHASVDAPPADETTIHLLRQIHRELKDRRADYGDFSFNKMLSGVFQMLAIGCVMFALFNLAQPTLFFQWMSGALLGQLATLTLLIIHGQR